MSARLLEVEERIDVTNLLPQVAVPTLILHRKKNLACSVKAGREPAVSIPNASLVLLDGVDHIPWLGDSESILRAVASYRY